MARKATDKFNVATIQEYCSRKAEQYEDDATVTGNKIAVDAMAATYNVLDDTGKASMWASIVTLYDSTVQQVVNISMASVRGAQLSHTLQIARASVEFLANMPTGKGSDRWTKGVNGMIEDLPKIKEKYNPPKEACEHIDQLSVNLSELEKAIKANDFGRRISIISNIVSSCLI